jgi:hypothetical protein
VIDNKTISTASQLFNIKDNWNEGLFEIRVKLPKGDNIESEIWLTPTANTNNRINLVSVVKQEPYIIKSGIIYENHETSYGFEGTLPYDITSGFNVFTMEWTKNYIYLKIYGDLYHNQSLDKFYESQEMKNSNETESTFNGKFFIIFEINMNSTLAERVDTIENKSLISPHLYVDYIRIYEWKELVLNRNTNYDTMILVLLGMAIIVLFLFFCIAIPICYIKILERFKRKSFSFLDEQNPKKVHFSSKKIVLKYDNSVNLFDSHHIINEQNEENVKMI